MGIFELYLSAWVEFCILAGVIIRRYLPNNHGDEHIRGFLSKAKPLIPRRAADHSGATARFPGRTDYQPVFDYRAISGAGPDPGLLQLRAGLSAQSQRG